MNTKKVFAGAVTLLLVATNAIASQILTFEDLNPAPASFDLMPSSYNGLTFTGWYYGPDTIYTPASGVIDLFSDYADPSNPGAYIVTNSNNQITSTTPIVFEGAKFSGYSGVSFQLWSNGNLVHTSEVLPDAPGTDPYLPIFLASGYGGQVDKVVVSGVQGYYSMDDVVFTASAVPEPTSMLLVMVGLLCMGVVARHRR